MMQVCFRSKRVMKLKVAISTAIACSASLIPLLLIAVVVLLQDINTLYDDVMDEMDAFKVS